MRVIAGEYGGRRLKGLAGDNTRPTTDKVKEAIFNIIGPYFDGGKVLDLYAGSGALAIEAISRGMEQAVCIEKNQAAIRIIKENIAMTKEPEKFIIKKMDAAKALMLFQEEQVTFDLVLLDPPYAQQDIVNQIKKMAGGGLINNGTIIVCETEKSVILDETINQLVKTKEVVYGITKITIYRTEVSND